MILSADTLSSLRSTPTILLDGCFDPLHAGHVAYLREARQMFPQYRMVVAVAPDQAIREKGREPLLSAESRAAVVGAIAGVDDVFVNHLPTEQVMGLLRPQIYVKGKDWMGKLPEAVTAACSLFTVPVVYTDTVSDSSSDALRRWALGDAERGLDRLETFMAAQVPASEPWQPVTDYSFEARQAIEGRHPRLIVDTFQAGSILDVGCGPGHLVRLLKLDGAGHVCGMDLGEASDDVDWYLHGDIADPCLRRIDQHELVICREVLEHLTALQIAVAVRNLFRLSSKFLYITTRFSDRGVFDAATDLETDPTHITCLSQPFLRSLCVLNGGKRRRDLEEKLDWQQKGRVLVYQVS